MALDVCGRKSSVNYDIYRAALTGGLSSYFETASFGAYRFPTSTTYNRVVLSKVPVGCSAWNDNKLASDKKRSAYADEADIWVTKNLGINVFSYTHHLYLMPPEVEPGQYGVANCFGLAETNLDLWMPAQTSNPWLVGIVHELGHNMGLGHSRGYDDNGIIQEYGDGSCPMGSAPALVMYNAAQSVALGWTVPQAVWKNTDMPVGKWLPFKLRGLGDARISSLRIDVGSWMNGASGWEWDEQVIVSFRRYTSTGIESGLRQDYRNKVQVHRFSPNAFYDSCGGVLALSNLDSTNQPMWPKPGSNNPADTSSPLLAVRVARIDTVGGAAYINVCRAQTKGRESGAQCSDGLDNDCDGRVDNC
ncbi:hypothetical protein HYH03_001860 [Edaphochlamys debaryana]|uniref:Peptidase M11 gametolysin domain-containing protein n=1 Tax=Edaphochlamys debaryana TaxID=47281 RepID=A0A835YC87_9CHLO|nr:hypothetical protein HYH03_001860 [Edaphochlamys debaryana]|eukprot:KAG2500282.1 hypothetical protein HYH03_001860 [Edaphochlamys debaryana]